MKGEAAMSQRLGRAHHRDEVDLLVIGGGVFGACAAWEAAQRGLTVALIERGDFAGETSANHFRVVHGGIRYLQHADLERVRESSRERTTLLRVAPHLVSPLPILMPTYGRGRRGKGLMRVGCALYDLLTADRNRGLSDPDRRIPRSYGVSRHEVLRRFPHLPSEGLTGGVVFWDGQVHHPGRLVLAFLRAAVATGRARVANYLAARRFLREDGRVRGVEAEDVLRGGSVRIPARVVLNAAGPWAAELLEEGLGAEIAPRPTFSRDLAFVTRRRIAPELGLACAVGSSDADALLDRGGRHLFILPWRGGTLVGVWHKVHTEAADEVRVEEEELREYVREANEACPGLGLELDDITEILTGLVLFGDEDQDPEAHRFGKRSLLVDHRQVHGITGLVSLVGVRASVARGMAEEAVELVGRHLGRTLPASRTDRLPVYGGDVARMDDLVAEVREALPAGLPPEVADALARNHGSRYREVLDLAHRREDPGGTLGTSSVLGAEVAHAVRAELARTLEDIVLRRTDLAVARVPDDGELAAAARIAAEELSWSDERREAEVRRTREALERRRRPGPRRVARASAPDPALSGVEARGGRP